MGIVKSKRGVLLLFLTPFIVPLLAAFISWARSKDDAVYSTQDGAVFRRLSQEIRADSQKQVFIVTRGVTPGRIIELLDDSNRRTITYDRTKHTLEEIHKGTGCLGEWHPVYDRTIQRMAADNATFRDMEKYGAKCICP